MTGRIPRSDGFTLVEIIASLVLVGILASVAGMFIVTGMKSFETATTASEGALQGQIAINRMVAELTGIDPTQSITVTTNTSIAYTHAEMHSVSMPYSYARTISYNSVQKRINLTTADGTYPLIGGISAFTLAASTSDIDGDGSNEIAYVDIAFTIDGVGMPFQLRAFPRNLVNVP